MFEADLTVRAEQVKSAVADVMGREMAAEAKEAISRSVHENVYDAYDTDGFRRGDAGGLSDTDNYEHRVDVTGNTVTLTVENNTPFQGREVPGETLSEVVQAGSLNMPFPREYMEHATAEMGSGIAEEVLSAGLKTRGIL